MRRLGILGGLLLCAACGDDGGSMGQTETDGASSSTTGGADGPVATSTVADDSGTTNGSDDSTGEPPVNEPPVAVFEVSTYSGAGPFTVDLDASASSDPDGTIVSWEWTFDDGTTAAGQQVSHTFEDGGCHSIDLVVTDDAGATGAAADMVAVVLGAPMTPVDAMVDTAPLPSAVLPRDVATNEGTARFSGTLNSTGWGEVVAEIVSEKVVVGTAHQLVCAADAPWTFEVNLPVPAERTSFEVRLSAGLGELREPIMTVPDVVAGDVYIVQGQSNAVSSQYNGDANVDQGPFIRTFNGTQWVVANGNAGGENSNGGIGQWPMRMSGALSQAHEMPIAIINAANGGQPIGFFQRNDDNPLDTGNNYGRLLTRIQAADLQQGIRAILWYQGESDGGNFQAHHDGFLALVDDWKVDYGPIERIYVTQIRAGCSGNLIGTQEVQRTLPDTFPEMTVMSTTALDGHDGCHYAYAEGYEELGNRYAGLLGRDLYEESPANDVQPPNPASAQFAAGGTQILVTLRNAASTVTWQDGAQADFQVDGAGVTVMSGSAAGNVVTLQLSGDGSAATGLTYFGRTGAGQWVTNENGIGMLEFQALPIDPE